MLWGIWGPQFLSETKPPLGLSARAELSRPQKWPPLYHCQIWGQMEDLGASAIPPKQECGVVRASLAKPPLHPHHPIPGPCSLLPLPKHLGVLGIFRPQLTGCEIAPFAPPQPGGGRRGRNGVGGAHSQFIRLLHG